MGSHGYQYRGALCAIFADEEKTTLKKPGRVRNCLNCYLNLIIKAAHTAMKAKIEMM